MTYPRHNRRSDSQPSRRVVTLFAFVRGVYTEYRTPVYARTERAAIRVAVQDAGLAGSKLCSLRPSALSYTVES